eukprot:TRINITY_DN9862_c0_g3_i1.p1 TRINITY_DN9862_c0_g3~~TRINITY_DN9862_c0_g3_i1.p1  ORF type:complete len:102 (+),score=0.10 TRINITY_DN9862_c0_g3_i1:42-308(+)
MWYPCGTMRHEPSQLSLHHGRTASPSFPALTQLIGGRRLLTLPSSYPSSSSCPSSSYPSSCLSSSWRLSLLSSSPSSEPFSASSSTSS